MKGKEPFPSEDLSNIHALTLEYAKAWLAKDSERVMGLFSPDAVLIPHHGDPMIEGEAAKWKITHRMWDDPLPQT